MTSAWAVAKSRPSAESPACTITGRPWGERGTSNTASTSNRRDACRTRAIAPARKKAPVSASASIASSRHDDHSAFEISANSDART